MTRLGDLCQIDPPKSEARQKLSSSDSVSFVPMSDLGEGYKHFEPKQVRQLGEVVGSYTYFADNDVLLAKITPCFENGKLGIAQNLTNGIGFGSSEYLVLRPSSALNPDYLYYFLDGDSFRQAGARVMSGAVGHKRVPKDFIENLALRVPPIAEQKRIVAILDEAFAGIAAATANAEKNLANARELFKGLLNSALSQRTTSWIDLRLGEFATISYGYTEKATFEEIGPKFLRITDIQEDGVDWDTVPTCPIGDADFKRHRLLDGDIVFARTGATTGKSYLIATPPPAVAASYLIRCRLNKSDMLPSYVALYFQSDQYWEHVAKGTTGSAQGGFNASKLAELVIPIPTFSEQKKLVEKFDYLKTEIGRLETIYRQKLDALIDLRQSALQQAFSGELTGAKNRHSEAA